MRLRCALMFYVSVCGIRRISNFPHEMLCPDITSKLWGGGMLNFVAKGMCDKSDKKLLCWLEKTAHTNNGKSCSA